jgi:hypothetical protein
MRRGSVQGFKKLKLMKYESLNEKKVYRLIHFIYYTHQIKPKKNRPNVFSPNKVGFFAEKNYCIWWLY